MKKNVITSRQFECGGETYWITVRHYDRDLGYVTAEWSGKSHSGELGFGMPDCESAISGAEQAIADWVKASARKGA